MRFVLSALILLLPGAASAGARTDIIAVPEPTSLAIVAAAVGGLALARKLRGPRR